MSFLAGFDFRGSAGGASDPANCTYVLGGVAGISGDYYPTFRDGFTFGIDSGTFASSDRTGATDPRLDGINYNSTPGGIFRVDLPNPGTYRIYCAFGDAEGGLNSPDQTVNIFDNAAGLLAIGPMNMAFLGSGVWYDAHGNPYNESQWAAASLYGGEASISLQFATTVFKMDIESSSGFWGVSHLFIEEVPAGLALPFFTSVDAKRI